MAKSSLPPVTEAMKKAGVSALRGSGALNQRQQVTLIYLSMVTAGRGPIYGTKPIKDAKAKGLPDDAFTIDRPKQAKANAGRKKKP
jgi:hypothetical protein